MTTLLDVARHYHTWNANVNAIVRGDKRPLNKWKHLHSHRQELSELESYPWQNAGGVGINNGPGGWHTFDIDAIKTDGVARIIGDSTINALLDALHLPRDYPWVWRGKSKAGWALAIRCDEALASGILPAKKEETGVAWGWPAKDSGADWHHLELRWTNCQTNYPPTQGYHWRGGAPSEAPTDVPLHRILAAFFTLCPQPAHTLSTIDEATKAQIRERLDLVEYAVQHFGGDTQRESNGEIRVLGHAGLLINPDKHIWHCFGNEVGGDWAELIAYAKYRTSYQNLNGKGADILKEGAAFAGVALAERKPECSVSEVLTAKPETARRWLREDEIEALRPPTWLIKGVIPASEVTMIVGPGDAGKTFIAVDMMKQVAQHYPVMFVAAEDAAGIRLRKRAWELHHFKPRNGHFLMWPEPLDLTRAETVDSFIDEVRPLGLRMVVLDTFSQCIAGADENSNAEMSAVMTNVQRIAHELNAAVVPLHHTTKDGATYRGASALKNNTYGLLEVARDDDLIKLECGRIKNTRPFAPKHFKLIEVATDIPDEANEPTISCVIAPAQRVIHFGDELTQMQAKILDLIAAATDGDGGIKSNELQTTLGLKGNSFFGPMKRLRRLGLIQNSTDKHMSPLVVTDKGRERLAQLAAEQTTATPDVSFGTAFTFEVNTDLDRALPALPVLPSPTMSTTNNDAILPNEHGSTHIESVVDGGRSYRSTTNSTPLTSAEKQQCYQRYHSTTNPSGSTAHTTTTAVSPDRESSGSSELVGLTKRQGEKSTDPLAKVEWRDVRQWVVGNQMEALRVHCELKKVMVDQVLADPRARAEIQRME